MFFTFSFFFLYGINTHFKNIFFHTSELININISVYIPNYSNTYLVENKTKYNMHSLFIRKK